MPHLNHTIRLLIVAGRHLADADLDERAVERPKLAGHVHDDAVGVEALEGRRDGALGAADLAGQAADAHLQDGADRVRTEILPQQLDRRNAAVALLRHRLTHGCGKIRVSHSDSSSGRS